MAREMRELKDIFVKIFNTSGEIPQQPPARATFAKPLRRISILFHSNEAISEASEAEDSVPRHQIPNAAQTFPQPKQPPHLRTHLRTRYLPTNNQ